jgi:MSHA pilin protein MshD
VSNPRFEIRNPKWNGFTLIETVITLVVLSIAAVGVLSVFTIGIKGSADPLIMNQAIQLAQGELDQVFGEKTANGFGAATLATGATVACNSTMLAGFSCNRSICFVPAGNLNAVSPCETAAATNYKHVTVTITQVATGSSIGLDTIISNY